MLSSQKVFYLVLISIMLLCSIFGISVQGANTYFPVEQIEVIGMPEESQSVGVVGQLSDMEHGSVGFDSTSMGVDVSSGNTTTTEEGYTHNDNVSYLETTTTTTAPTEPDPGIDPNGSGNGGNSESSNDGSGNNGGTTATASAPAPTTTTSQTNVPAPNAPAQATTTTTTTAYVPPTTTTTTTTTTRTTTTTTRATTTTTKHYTNSGSISFSLSSGGSTVTEYRMYVGSSVKLYLKSGFADTPIAVYNSDYSYVADAVSNEIGSVVVTAYSVGTTWIHASNINGSCHIKITVDDFESRVVYLCNEQRAANGIGPLSIGGSDLKRVADLRLSEASTKFSHTRPNGSRYITAYNYYGLAYLYAGENLARGQTSPEQVVTEWMNSPTHRANILNPNFKYCSVSVGNARYAGVTHTYWSQQFYTPQY